MMDLFGDRSYLGILLTLFEGGKGVHSTFTEDASHHPGACGVRCSIDRKVYEELREHLEANGYLRRKA